MLPVHILLSLILLVHPCVCCQHPVMCYWHQLRCVDTEFILEHVQTPCNTTQA
jgi:hypothetical protein